MNIERIYLPLANLEIVEPLSPSPISWSSLFNTSTFLNKFSPIRFNIFLNTKTAFSDIRAPNWLIKTN